MSTLKHRGRLQAQGPDTEKSESWSQDEPLTKEDGLSLLNKLQNQLTPTEREDRADQLDRARRFIEQAEGGVDAPLGKSFVNRKQRGVRVDVEVLAGTAFLVTVVLYFLL